MIWEGTERYREKAQISMKGWADYFEPSGTYYEDVLTLCDKVEEFDRKSEVTSRKLAHLANERAKLQAVVDAASTLVSAMTGDKRYRDDFKEVMCLDALRDALDALEQKA